jgi:serine phosphatase RsbU (regulator of sigma subunit)
MMLVLAWVTTNEPLISGLFPPQSLAEQVRNAPMLIYSVLFFALAAAYLALWRTATDFRVFRNMGFYQLLVGIQVLTIYLGGNSFQWALIDLTSPFIVMIAGEAMRVPDRRWTLLAWPLCLFAFVAGWFPALSVLRFRGGGIDITEIFLCILTFQGFRHGQKRDRQVAAAFVFLIIARSTVSPFLRSLTHLPLNIDVGVWRWHLNPAALILVALATLAVYVRDLIEDRREKRRLAAELEAARGVQQVLIPEEIPSVAGFAIQGIYRPAGEVGGDFFQIFPVKDGAVLIVMGDVSGKGLPAAMTVSLLAGAVRTLVHYTQSPGEILAAMNQRMLHRNGGGFTTCVAVLADRDGTLTVANAGHLAPYLGGQEIPLESGLPLGLSADTVYVESIFTMADGQQLTIVTDGVVEARDPSGALFGFERTALHSTESAEAIVEAAQRFGQEDDISIICLTLTSIMASASG